MSTAFLAQLAVDLDLYLNDFGETATYTPDGGAASSIQVIFDDADKSIQLEAGIIGSTDPRAFCKVSDVPGVNQKATLAVRGTTYKVVDPQPDGTGFITLVLKK